MTAPTVRALALCVALALLVCGCGAKAAKPAPDGGEPTPADVPTGADAKPRLYHGHTWAELRTSVGHAAHGGTEKVACKDCHDKGYERAPDVACGRQGCHAPELARAHSAKGEKGCAACHPFELGKTNPKCLDCHKDAQPRAAGELAAVTDGHAKADCAKCHQSHRDPLSQPGDCKSCHDQGGGAHAAHSGSKGCSDCHAPHTRAAAARDTCAGCHKDPVGPQPAEHKSCVDCHAPHADAPTTFEACIRCHGKKVTLVASRVAKHAECTSCHAPHSPKTVGDASCEKCHVKARVVHPAHAPDLKTAIGTAPPRACSACHVPHPASGQQKVARCSSCHEKVGTSDKGVHAASLSCTSCHRPHDFAAPSNVARSGFCARCHGRESKLASGRTGHVDCTACHASAHVKAPPPACGTCHAPELAGLPAGHARCQDCHDPHSGDVRSADLCSGCHADRTTGPHRKVAGGCKTCHRPHGPSGVATPPACGACHRPPARIGLHRAAGHADCARCHTSHEPPRASRESCTSSGCHADRQAHEPDAKRCNTCHLFAW